MAKLPNVTKKRILDYLKEGKRFDGRKPLEFRDIKIETKIIKKAEGSARVRLGDTEVLAGVKLDTMEPYPDSPDSGNLMITAEFSPMASELFEKGPPSIEAIELARIIDRGIRESEVIDLKKLCIKEGEKVWSVMIDIYPINNGGNLIDACSLAAMAALKTTVLPKLTEENKVKYGDFSTKKLPLRDAYPLTMTFHKVGDQFLLDPTTEEEGASEARLSLALSMSKKEEMVHAMQKGGEATLSIDEVNTILDTSKNEIKKLLSVFEKSIK